MGANRILASPRARDWAISRSVVQVGQPRTRRTTRTSTRAGREGAASERQSRTAALCWQKPQSRESEGDITLGVGARGASQAGHANVPIARTCETACRCIDLVPLRTSIASGLTGSAPSIPRCNATKISLGVRKALARLLVDLLEVDAACLASTEETCTKAPRSGVAQREAGPPQRSEGD